MPAQPSPNGPFQLERPSLNSPAQVFTAVTPADGVVLNPTPRGLYIGTAGNVYLKPLGAGTTVAFLNVPAGFILPVMPSSVESTNTTASNIVALS